VTLGVSWTYLYLFVMSDLILADTAQIQTWITEEKERKGEGVSVGGGAFPERATRGIPMENIYGAVKFIRIHHADKATATDDHGFTARPVSYELNYSHARAIKEGWGVTGGSKTGSRPLSRPTCCTAEWTPTGSINLPANTWAWRSPWLRSELRVAEPGRRTQNRRWPHDRLAAGSLRRAVSAPSGGRRWHLPARGTTGESP
jgi:hypothetical protein